MTRSMVARDAPIVRHTRSSPRRWFMSMDWAVARAASTISHARPARAAIAPEWPRMAEAVPVSSSPPPTAVTLRT